MDVQGTMTLALAVDRGAGQSELYIRISSV